MPTSRFYLWLQDTADAIVHLGAHGTLEWLPGKAAALSAACWPRALIGGLPVIYPFIVNNPGEAAAAKRRLGAVTIGHLTPPLRPAGSHGAATELERMIDEYAAADGLDRRRTDGAARPTSCRSAEAAGLLAESGVPPDAPEDDALARLDAYLCDVKDLQIRDGLHVFATAPDPGRRTLLMTSLASESLSAPGGGEGRVRWGEPPALSAPILAAPAPPHPDPLRPHRGGEGRGGGNRRLRALRTHRFARRTRRPLRPARPRRRAQRRAAGRAAHRPQPRRHRPARRADAQRDGPRRARRRRTADPSPSGARRLAAPHRAERVGQRHDAHRRRRPCARADPARRPPALG